MRSFTDKAALQLKKYASDCFDLFKKKFKQTSVQRGKLAPMMLNPEGKDMLFPNKKSIDLFVRCFMECVSTLFFGDLDCSH